jgi:hypothetical protein
MKLFAPTSRPEPVVADTASGWKGQCWFHTVHESNYEIWRAHDPISSFGLAYIETHSLYTSYIEFVQG